MLAASSYLLRAMTARNASMQASGSTTFYPTPGKSASPIGQARQALKTFSIAASKSPDPSIAK